MVDWDKPIYASFSDESKIKSFIFGTTESGTTWVGIPHPKSDDEGVMIEVNNEGYSIKTNKQIIIN